MGHASAARTGECTVIADCPLPYHVGYEMPTGFSVVSRASEHWWQDVVTYRPGDDGPAWLVGKLIVPNGTVPSQIQRYSRSPSAHYTARSGMRRPSSESEKEVAICTVGTDTEIYVICEDVDVSKAIHVVVKPHIVPKEWASAGYMVAGETPGVYLTQWGMGKGQAGCDGLTTRINLSGRVVEAIYPSYRSKTYAAEWIVKGLDPEHNS